MNYLLDTCTFSEPTHKLPNPGVTSFLGQLRAGDAFISTLSVAEIWKGIQMLSPSKRRAGLETWFETELLTGFAGRVLGLDVTIAQRQGALAATLIQAGRTMPIFDSFIAATALAHNLTIVTRNEVDFAPSGVRILNPWK